MKQVIAVFSVCVLFLAGETVFAQTASDYYLPLSPGSYATLTTNGSAGWEARTTDHAIVGSDSISGRQYFIEKGTESIYVSGQINVFEVFWLRKDSAGNVAIGAAGFSGSTNLDSAMLMSGVFFPNEFLTKGYSRIVPMPWGNQTVKDSVVSVAATVTVRAGTFNNCLELSETHFDSTGNAVWNEHHYYAYGVGMVKNVRTLPADDAHTEELMAYSGGTGIRDIDAGRLPQNPSLLQMYTTPSNPCAVIRYRVASPGRASLKVYDLGGREVAALVYGVKAAGLYTTTFNTADLPGNAYFCRLEAPLFAETKRLVLIK